MYIHAHTHAHTTQTIACAYIVKLYAHTYAFI